MADSPCPEWITDRLPTAADGDQDGYVKIKAHLGDQSTCDPVWAHYTVIVPGQPWWSPNAAARAAQSTPPAAPAPTRVVTALTFDPDNVIIAACNDGTLWAKGLNGEWYQIPSIPQPEAPNA